MGDKELFKYKCRHIPSGKVYDREAYFDSRKAFLAAMSKWNKANPTIWLYYAC